MSKTFAYLFIVLTVLFMFGVAVSIAHGSTAQPRPNTLGVLQTYENVNTYLFGLPVEGTVLDGAYTRITFKPYATPVIYSTTILFCGDVIDPFKTTRGPVVLTFKTQASGMYQGTSCHELIGVFQVKGE